MPKTTFVKGTVVTAEFLNSINAPIFDGTDADGHRGPLTDAELDPTPGSVKTGWQTFRDELKVSAGIGLTVSWVGGSVTRQDGSITTIAPSQIALPPSTSNYIFVDNSGSVAAATTYPLRSTPLARVTTSPTAILTIEDLRPRFAIQALGQSVRVFGGSGSQGDYTLNSGSATLSGEYYYKNFTIGAGATLTIAGSANIYCSGDVNITGTINVTPPVKGGGALSGGVKPQDYSNTQGLGIAGGNSVNGPASPPYSYSSSPLGSGGAGPWITVASGSGGITGSKGGNGGGAVVFEVGGSISVSGAIAALGESGQGAAAVLNPSALSMTISGTGGGSGGLIWLKSMRSILVTAAASLSVRGGDGGTGYPNPTTQLSGGGGGGGYVTLNAPAINTSGATINLAGGASPYSTGTYGAVSGGSFAGQAGGPGQPGGVGQLILRTSIPV
jgi:hypothetical protein